MSTLLSVLTAALLLATDVTCGETHVPQAAPLSPTRPSPLAERLLRLTDSPEQAAIDAVFGVEGNAADRVFYPVAPWQPLPDGFVPPDLVRLGGIPRARLTGQRSGDAGPRKHGGRGARRWCGPGSAFGVPLVWRPGGDFRAQRPAINVLARGNSRTDAERAAERFSARPGHSQHQLGTAIDFTTAQIGYGLGARFAETDTGRWLLEHSWRFGFVFPYTETSEPRSGYRNEPWHVRWVGRELAEIMQRDGYLRASFPIADDYVLAVEIMSQKHAKP